MYVGYSFWWGGGLRAGKEGALNVGGAEIGFHPDEYLSQTLELSENYYTPGSY